MSTTPVFLSAFPYQNDVLALPVSDLDAASQWYGSHFGMTEVKRSAQPVPTVILERDQVQLGFAVNGKDPSQDGAAILVNHLEQLKLDLTAVGTNVANSRIDERDGQKYQVFFVVAPDGLCYYFHEPAESP